MSCGLCDGWAFCNSLHWIKESQFGYLFVLLTLLQYFYLHGLSLCRFCRLLWNSLQGQYVAVQCVPCNIDDLTTILRDYSHYWRPWSNFVMKMSDYFYVVAVNIFKFNLKWRKCRKTVRGEQRRMHSFCVYHVHRQPELDGCIMWNAHNTVFGSKRSAVCALAVYFVL